MKWRDYEKQIFQAFQEKYPDYEILFDQKLRGRHSKVLRQIDILVKPRTGDFNVFGVFDCKHFSKKVNVITIDSMLGFADDVGANWCGVISSIGFSAGAQNRAKASRMDLRVIPFRSPETIIDEFMPSLDFSDSRNSMYLVLI